MLDTIASIQDLLRLVALPAFAWAAWQDHRTRRVPSWLWWPLIGLGVGLLTWDALANLARPPPAAAVFLFRAGISVGFLVPLALAFYRFNLMGGADAKAFIALAVLFPTYPIYRLDSLLLPTIRPVLGVFSLTVITNAALLGVLYPIGLTVRNLVDGAWSPAMVRARRVSWTALPTMHGRLAETADGRTLHGLDLDALRMYLRWRRSSLVDLRIRPAELRDPASVPDEPGNPTDGRVDPADRLDREEAADRPTPTDNPSDSGRREFSDPWAAEEFLASVGSAYGTTPKQLREGLELISRADRVWVSPGLPYLVPVFAGLVIGLSYGDLLYGMMRAFGLW